MPPHAAADALLMLLIAADMILTFTPLILLPPLRRIDALTLMHISFSFTFGWLPLPYCAIDDYATPFAIADAIYAIDAAAFTLRDIDAAITPLAAMPLRCLISLLPPDDTLSPHYATY